MSLEGKSVLVTGGAGFIGSHLVDTLIKYNLKNLVVVDNCFIGKEKNLESAKRNFSKLKFYKDNVADFKTFQNIVKEEEIDILFNLAIIPLPASLNKPIWAWQENIRITEVICEIARSNDIETLIHFSSSEAYGSAVVAPMNEMHPLNPTTPYAASKAATDHLINSYIITYGIDAGIVRPFNNYGPRQNEGTYAGIIPIVINRIKNKKSPVIYGDGNQTRDYLYVTDTARAAIMAYNNPKTRKRIINIGSGIEISINKVVNTIVDIMGYEGDIIYKKSRIGDVRQHWADISIARNLIGFVSQISFKKGIEKTINWYLTK